MCLAPAPAAGMPKRWQPALKLAAGAVVTKSITVKGAVNTTRHMISNGNMSLLNNEGGSDMPMTPVERL